MPADSHYRFQIWLPARYTEGSEAYPLLLFLHGMGERGDDPNQLTVHGPPKQVSGAQRPAALEPFVVLAPHCPADQTWSASRLLRLLDEVVTNWRIDRRRIYLTGISMGGYGAWSLAQEQPERFAALCPICGGGDTERAARLQNLPIWMFHSAGDQVVPVAESDRLFAALQQCNATVTYTRYRALDHVQTWEHAYALPGLYEWLLQHRT
ncbi:MAG: dienelactone hydrolase family protein [Gammaproteobacteria bacterium]|nr:dienelactone hydrolase family protein [Gammaproteobacteria bacterium]MCP5425602.1 dienelactone hydrolase family protein [Gammaproteobacteria bacterium]MCP5458998.1 dienelactone hydrolase family protein [Gammaproteobacteria bacterium]